MRSRTRGTGAVWGTLPSHFDASRAWGEGGGWARSLLDRQRRGAAPQGFALRRDHGRPGPLADDEIAKFQAVVDTIEAYADRYEFDWLMIAAQGYQESKLDQSTVSPAGPIGVMQILPSTAADPNVAIADIELLDSNVHAGVKYLRFLRDRYFSDPAIAPLDQEPFSFAAYNAGPGNIAKARAKAAAMGFDPNRWFQNVEFAAAKVISQEPVRYVRNIYKYYVAYRMLSEQAAAQRARQGCGEDTVERHTRRRLTNDGALAGRAEAEAVAAAGG
jgi:soluble lytic murein transglycosylase-like protein